MKKYIVIILLLFPLSFMGQGRLRRDQPKPQVTATPSKKSQPVSKQQAISPKEKALQLFIDGNKEWDEGNIVSGINKIIEAANLGEPEAQYFVGQFYYYGFEKIVPQNKKLALEWHLKAANQGIFDSQLKLGDMYRLGEGTEKNGKESFKWYEKAYKNRPDNAEAQLALAGSNLYGVGCNQNVSLGLSLLNQAVKQDLPMAQAWIGELYLTGEFAPQLKKNYVSAKKYSEIAANAGIPNAMYNMGQIYENGYGVTKDLNQAKEWYKKAADQGHEEAKTALQRVENQNLLGATGQHYNHYYVDLGLPSGNKWATCNIGAFNPWEFGKYYAWGENSDSSWYIDPLKTYDKKKLKNFDFQSFDTAKKQWGGSWVTPTEADFRELLGFCTWQLKEFNGIQGFLVTGKNNNSIFLPLAGRKKGNSVELEGVWGRYWTSTPTTYNSRSYCLILDNYSKDGNRVDDTMRDYRLTIRPVLKTANNYR